jgi:hypothetical protein
LNPRSGKRKPCPVGLIEWISGQQVSGGYQNQRCLE